jgi:hypothetical protein
LEYFDVYSEPIATLYGQVHWRAHPTVKLPDDIIQRFENKVMAIVGYEVDQVRIMDDENNHIEEQEETQQQSVPITWAYNHHYGAFLLNSRTTRLVPKNNNKKKKQVIATPAEATQLHHDTGHTTHLMAEFINDIDEDYDDSYDFPQVHFFSEGNGGEMRLSYHGYPTGYAQLLDSPDAFQVTPMQIDTWNRERMTNATYVPGGPLPKSSSIPNHDDNRA